MDEVDAWIALVSCIVHLGSPASCSLLKVGDEIVSVNSVPVFADEETTERIKKVCSIGKE